MNSPRTAPKLAVFFLAAILFAAALPRLLADPNSHVTDGFFTSANEWAGPDVTKIFFPVSGQAGGAYLYVEQGFIPAAASTERVSDRVSSDMPAAIGQRSSLFLPLPNPAAALPNTLFLMYDWVNSNNVFAPGSANVFSDVFFEVPRANPAATPANDYLVRIFSNSANNFQAFERTHGSNPPLNPDGSFNISNGSGWVALTAADLTLANFRTAIGFGTSPNASFNHLMIEFQLSINRGSDSNPTGLYDPAPAFWSASGDGSPNARGDPPISSGIFTLNPDGTTTVNPQFDSTGAPAKIPSQAVPEPASLLLLGAGMVMLLARGVRRR